MGRYGSAAPPRSCSPADGSADRGAEVGAQHQRERCLILVTQYEDVPGLRLVLGATEPVLGMLVAAALTPGEPRPIVTRPSSRVCAAVPRRNVITRARITAGATSATSNGTDTGTRTAQPAAKPAPCSFAVWQSSPGWSRTQPAGCRARCRASAADRSPSRAGRRSTPCPTPKSSSAARTGAVRQGPYQ
jgi:hypothetical protein